GGVGHPRIRIKIWFRQGRKLLVIEMLWRPCACARRCGRAGTAILVSRARTLQYVIILPAVAKGRPVCEGAARLRRGGPFATGRLGRRRMGGVPWSRAIMSLLAVALAAGVGLAAVGPGPAGPAAGLPSAGLDAVGPIAGPAVFGPIAGASSAALEWPLIVHFFDVDQGDAILFQGEDFTILIDAGRHDRSDVVPHLERAGVDYIDLFIGTHPHADHIGQCAAVVRRFPVGEVWLSGETHTTLTFERCIDAILESEAGYREPRAG